jgi:hypothetical protein
VGSDSEASNPPNPPHRCVQKKGRSSDAKRRQLLIDVGGAREVA